LKDFFRATWCIFFIRLRKSREKDWFMNRRRLDFGFFRVMGSTDQSTGLEPNFGFSLPCLNLR